MYIAKKKGSYYPKGNLFYRVRATGQEEGLLYYLSSSWSSSSSVALQLIISTKPVGGRAELELGVDGRPGHPELLAGVRLLLLEVVLPQRHVDPPYRLAQTGHRGVAIFGIFFGRSFLSAGKKAPFVENQQLIFGVFDVHELT